MKIKIDKHVAKMTGIIGGAAILATGLVVGLRQIAKSRKS